MAKIIKILISEKNERIIESISEYFSDKPVELMFCPKNGQAVLDNINKYHPDVVVCDVFMSRFDAIYVKEQASSIDKPPQVFIITSAYDNDDIIKRTLSAGFNFYFIKPFSPENLYDRIISFFVHSPSHTSASVVEACISRILHRLEMPSHLNGFNYICLAVKLVIEHPGYINSITKKLYPRIAKDFGTTASRVERSIRTAIETAWQRASNDAKEQYFHYYSHNDIKPSNGEFVALLADIIRNSITYEKLC